MRSRNYDREFKLNAVRLHPNGGKKASKVGIPDSTFFLWVKEYSENREDSFRGSGKVKS